MKELLEFILEYCELHRNEDEDEDNEEENI